MIMPIDNTRQGFYNCKQWLKLRSKILQRDKYTCALCGYVGTPRKTLVVDHIKPRLKHPELTFEPSNLQTVCKPCHYKICSVKDNAKPIDLNGFAEGWQK